MHQRTPPKPQTAIKVEQPDTTPPIPAAHPPTSPNPQSLSAAPSWSVPALLDLLPTASTHPPLDDQPARLLLNMLSWTSATLLRGVEDAMRPGSTTPSHDGAPPTNPPTRISHRGSVESDWLTSALGRLVRQPSAAAAAAAALPLRSLSTLSAFLEDDSLWAGLPTTQQLPGGSDPSIGGEGGLGTSAVDGGNAVNSFAPSSVAAGAPVPASAANPFALGGAGGWGQPCLLVPTDALLQYDAAAWGGAPPASASPMVKPPPPLVKPSAPTVNPPSPGTVTQPTPSPCAAGRSQTPTSPLASSGSEFEAEDSEDSLSHTTRKRKWGGRAPVRATPRKAAGGMSSTYRGVSRHRLTQRWEASLWLEGKQLYLGGFDSELDAARAYDIAAITCKVHPSHSTGAGAPTNFPRREYSAELDTLRGMCKEEVVAYVRRRSNAFSRGRSRFRGVSGSEGRWESRIGSFCGRKNVSFGVHDTEEGAARQYDRGMIIEKGAAAKTNFPLRDYIAEVKRYEAYMEAHCGGATGPGADDVRCRYTLPLHAGHPFEPEAGTEASRPSRSARAAVVLAESLRKALARNMR